MKSFIAFLLCFALALSLFMLSSCSRSHTLTELISEETATVTDYSVYGTHLNLDISVGYTEGAAYELLLVNSDFNEKDISSLSCIYFPLEEISRGDESVALTTSAYINGGINLEDISNGEFAVFVKETLSAKNSKVNNTYYALNNSTAYGLLSYYSLSDSDGNDEITIDFYEYPFGESTLLTLGLICEKCSLPDNVYDIVLEVGHGGSDPGAVGSLNSEQIYESELNLKMALKIEELLKKQGYKVALTRYDDTNTPSYGYYSRCGLCNTYKAKYNFSIHNNSNTIVGYTGTEVFIPRDCEPSLAQAIADKLSECFGYSTNEHYRISNGVYMRLHTAQDVIEEELLAEEGGFAPYEKLVEGTNYYFMLREIGGINTQAYVDGRNPLYEANPYRDSNITAEGYIIEMGYMNTQSNLEDLVKNYESYAQKFVDGLIGQLKENK